LFSENRLTLYIPQPRFDPVSQGPQNELQALYIDRPAQKRLEEETGKVFRNAVWLDSMSMHHQHLLRVSGNPQAPSPEDRIDVDRAKAYRSIEDEGHGLKSYTGIAIALLLGRRAVCLIDEPEMCLHPPQAYSLGRFIGQYGTSKTNLTMVATHSSHVLRGIIETAKELTVVRMTNIEGNFTASELNDQELRAAIKNGAPPEQKPYWTEYSRRLSLSSRLKEIEPSIRQRVRACSMISGGKYILFPSTAPEGSTKSVNSIAVCGFQLQLWPTSTS
jgi:hypothetical protein